MDGEEIARTARKSIGRYCIEECHSFCCRKGYLVMNSKEMDMLFKGAEPKEFEIKKLQNGNFSLNINNGCPCLVDFKCSIHNKRNRPSACQQFPLIIKQNKIYLSNRCPAVKEQILFPFIKKLQNRGYELQKTGLDISSLFE